MTDKHYPALGLFIDGRWLGADAGRDTLPVMNPATGETLGRLPMATAADVQAAIEAAARSFAAWKSTPALDRCRVLQRIAALIRRDMEALCRILTLEQGKTLKESQGELASTADTFEWMGEEAKRAYGRVVPARTRMTEQVVLREPVGPVGAFAPWNYPAVLSARKIAPALAAGCTVVIKPAEETPGILVAIARLCEEAGVPAGVLNVVFGDPGQISGTIIDSPVIRHLSFTGSVPVGRHLATLAAKALKKITLELGGHSAAVVCADADLDRVVDMSVAAKFRNAGQICHSPARFFVHESVYDAFIQQFAERAKALRVGNGLQDEVQMGPLIHARRKNAIEQLTQDALDRGARLACGGAAHADGSGGHFWQPTVIANADPACLAMQEEIFGPVALIAPFSSLDDAVARANSTGYGLAAYGFTKSAEAMYTLQHALHAGSIAFNTYAISSPEMPFCGLKDSGLGIESGPEGFLEYLDVKSVIKSFA